MGTVIGLCHKTSELHRETNFYFGLDFEMNSYKEKNANDNGAGLEWLYSVMMWWQPHLKGLKH